MGDLNCIKGLEVRSVRAQGKQWLHQAIAAIAQPELPSVSRSRP